MSSHSYKVHGTGNTHSTRRRSILSRGGGLTATSLYHQSRAVGQSPWRLSDMKKGSLTTLLQSTCQVT